MIYINDYNGIEEYDIYEGKLCKEVWFDSSTKSIIFNGDEFNVTLPYSLTGVHVILKACSDEAAWSNRDRITFTGVKGSSCSVIRTQDVVALIFNTSNKGYSSSIVVRFNRFDLRELIYKLYGSK